MKILQVANFFKPSWEAGGPAKVVYELSKKLAENGHEVTVYTTDGFKPRLDVQKNKPVDVDGIKTYYFRNLSSYLTRKVNLPIPYYLPIVARRGIKDFDVIHIHEYRTMLAVVAHHYAKKYGVPYILQPRGSVPTISKSKQKKLFDTLFGHAIIKDASKIIASSKIESEQYRDVFPELNNEKVVHIPNGIDLETYQDLPKKGEFKKKYSVNVDEKIILFLSRIHERKGADLLIGAFSELKNKFGNVKLVIAGADEGYLDKLKLIVSKLDIKGEVIFPGPLYEEDKLEAYVDADIFVLPSKSKEESFGNVVLESLACGTPVIITDNCGVSEWITDDVGYVVECDRTQLYNALYKMLTDDEKEHMSGYAKKFVRGFSWNGTIEKYEREYHSLTNCKKESVK